MLCESRAHADRMLGVGIAKVLRRRLADLQAATSIKDLVAGNPHQLSDDSMAVELCDGHRLVFCANHIKNPTTEAGTLDWSKIYRVRIRRIDTTI